jgi:hypothetical protein
MVNPLVLLPALYITALLGQTDLGTTGVVVTAVGLAGLAVAIIAAIRRPSRSLLWLLPPLAVPYLYFLVVGVLLIGDHHEALVISFYALAFLASVAFALWSARRHRLALTGATLFLLSWAFIAYEATIFVFWTNLH